MSTSHACTVRRNKTSQTVRTTGFRSPLAALLQLVPRIASTILCHRRLISSAVTHNTYSVANLSRTLGCPGQEGSQTTLCPTSGLNEDGSPLFLTIEGKNLFTPVAVTIGGRDCQELVQFPGSVPGTKLLCRLPGAPCDGTVL